MLREFREFALRGNVMDMAVGIIIGAAFTGVVTSLVNDVLMPPLGMAMGGIDFSNYFLQLGMRDRAFASLQEARAAGAPVIAYGTFINALINLLIIAFALFVVIKQMNTLRRMTEKAVVDKPEAAPPVAEDVKLLAEIRDILKARA